MYNKLRDLDIYSCSLECNNVIYSIDMLRLKTYITFEKYNSIHFYFNTYFKDKVKRFWISDKLQCFRYNWNIEIEEGKSFYFGFCHNSEQKVSERFDPVYNFTIEFNPNKLKKNALLMYLLNMSGKWHIIRYDLAMDLQVNILDLIVDKTGKRKLNTISNGFDNKTYYLGNGDKRIKIYNKKIESDLHITGDLTRIEITREVSDFYVGDMVLWNYDNYFPEIFTNNYVYSLSDYIEKNDKSKTLYAVLYAVQCRLSTQRTQ